MRFCIFKSLMCPHVYQHFKKKIIVLVSWKTLMWWILQGHRVKKGWRKEKKVTGLWFISLQFQTQFALRLKEHHKYEVKLAENGNFDRCEAASIVTFESFPPTRQFETDSPWNQTWWHNQDQAIQQFYFRQNIQMRETKAHSTSLCDLTSSLFSTEQ